MKSRKMMVLVLVALTVLSLFSACISGVNPIPKGDEISLPGTTWVLTHLQGEEILSEITLIFDEERVSGNASCNNYGSQYTLEGMKLSLSSIESTLMACPAMEDEIAYLKTLSEVTELRLTSEQLMLLDDSGNEILVYAPMQHASLEGTTWTLTGWNTGSAISSVLLDTELTFELKDGGVSGKAGCNSYFSSYTVEDDSLSFGPVGSTEMYCMEPEGVMEQEVGYLKALGVVDSFEIYGDTLTLFDEEGARLLTFFAAE